MKKVFHLLLRHIPRPLLIKSSLYFKGVLSLLLRGSRFTDPIDGKSYRTFLPYGQVEHSRRDNVLSPGTLSLERHRLMWLYLQTCEDFQTNKNRVLHIAPEQCFYKRFKKMKNLNYVTADYDSPIADLHFDLHNIPLEDNQFDIVFCNHVLEHVEDDSRCMEELFRVMKPGAWGIFQVPIDINRASTYEDASITSEAEREIHFGQKDHLRQYGRDYKDRLEAAGFEVTICDFANQLEKEAQEKYRICAGEQLYICRKAKSKTKIQQMPLIMMPQYKTKVISNA